MKVLIEQIETGFIVTNGQRRAACKRTEEVQIYIREFFNEITRDEARGELKRLEREKS